MILSPRALKPLSRASERLTDPKTSRSVATATENDTPSAKTRQERGTMHDDPWEHGHFGEEEDAVFDSIADDGFPINPDWLRLTSVGIDIGSSTSHPAS